MDFWTIFVGLYLVSFILAIIMTYREQKARGQTTPVYAFMGYILCSVWPLVVAVTLVFSKQLDESSYPSKRY